MMAQNLMTLHGGFLKWVFLLKMIIFGCFGGTTIWGNSHIYLDKYTFVGGSNLFETQCSSKCFFSPTQLQHVQTKSLKSPKVLWICSGSVVWKKVPHFFKTELNLFHDRIEPNKHLPKTNECHPKKGSIFNRTYIIFQPLIFSTTLICFPGGIHDPIHCIASYAPTSFWTGWGSGSYRPSLPSSRRHLWTLHHFSAFLGKTWPWQFFRAELGCFRGHEILLMGSNPANQLIW